MKKLITIIILAGIIAAAWFMFPDRSKLPQMVGGMDRSFTSMDAAVTSVGHYDWTRIATTTPDVGFYRVCDTALGGVNANNPVYLAFMTTTTITSIPYGTLVESGKCYTMSQEQQNMFYGWIYAQASTSTTTVVQIYK